MKVIACLTDYAVADRIIDHRKLCFLAGRSPPPGCQFERSRDIVAVAFTRSTIAYTDADTWYPSWAPDGNMYSGWTDGEIGEESVHLNGPKAHTGNARSAREIVFPAKTISWVVFAVDSVSQETSNAGLAKMAVFKD